jgi:hypothetical protein
MVTFVPYNEMAGHSYYDHKIYRINKLTKLWLSEFPAVGQIVSKNVRLARRPGGKQDLVNCLFSGT